MTLDSASAKIETYQNQDFGVASVDKKVAEAAQKLSSNGTIADFNGGVVTDPSKVDSSLIDAVSEFRNEEVHRSENIIPPEALYGDRPPTIDRKVIITQSPSVSGALDTVIFDVMPRIDERGGADYEAVQPTHHPGVIQKYRYSTARSWSINAKLISRTRDEARRTLLIMNTIRSWRMPFFGEGTASSMPDFLGAPPPILTLKAYGTNMIGPVKCVMKDYNWAYDNTIDYIEADTGVAVPVIVEVSLSLEESWSPAETSSFSITDYKLGNMQDAYRGFSKPAQPPAGSGLAKEQQANDVAAATVSGATPLANSEPQNAYDAATIQKLTDLTKARIAEGSLVDMTRAKADGVPRTMQDAINFGKNFK
jgi:hypothetical protein